jgi:cytochrome c oxidase subunit 2
MTSTIGAVNPEGPVAESMADLWWFMFVLGSGVFIVVAAVLVIGLFRRRPPSEPRSPEPTPQRFGRLIVVGGVVMPVVVVSAVFAATVVAMRDVSRTAPADALVVEIVGHQWWWEVRYPAERVTTANEIHIPVGRPIAFQLTSADVIHSFWVPALGGKMDLLPDGVNTLVLEADVPGVHRTECAEFCGLHHAAMELTVVADQSQPSETPGEAATRRGQELFMESGCAQCHTIRGTAADGTTGPDLTHFASRSEIGAGVVPNTPEDLAAWIADPHEVKDGIAMPAADLSDAELEDLVAYVGTLG